MSEGLTSVGERLTRDDGEGDVTPRVESTPGGQRVSPRSGVRCCPRVAQGGATDIGPWRHPLLAGGYRGHGRSSLPRGPRDDDDRGEAIQTADIPGAAGLHQYTMTLLRDAVGTTIVDYLTSWRLSEAQRLLVATSSTISNVTFAAGFGSVIRLNECLTRRCGRTPREYRLAVRSL